MLNVTLASPQRHDRLTIFPLIAQDAPELPYTLMVEALAHGTLRIAEVGSGVVGELVAINSSAAPIVVLDGEQLIGAKQNRTTSRSLLLPASSEIRIPVSCMEQGRWHDNWRPFVSSRHRSPSTVRRKVREVEASMADGGGAPAAEMLSAAQGQVWSAISDSFSESGTRSPTGALNHLYESRQEDLEAWTRAFPPVDAQVGILAFVGERPIGLDVIGGTGLYARLHDRVLSGYLMDALGSCATAAEVPAGQAQGYLDRVSAAKRSPAPTVGLGAYAVITGEVVGGELSNEEALVHLSAFPAVARDTGGPPTPGSPIAPPSRRRR